MLSNNSILVVDDDNDNCEMLRSVLELSGASVVTANSVDAALEAFNHCPPHAVVTDMRLGNSDAYALIEKIREFNAKYKGYTPVIAVTGFSSPDDEKRAKAAGFKAYFTKPFNPTEVVKAINKALAS